MCHETVTQLQKLLPSYKNSQTVTKTVTQLQKLSHSHENCHTVTKTVTQMPIEAIS